MLKQPMNLCQKILQVDSNSKGLFMKKHLLLTLLLSGALYASECNNLMKLSSDIILDMSEAQTKEELIILYSEFTIISDSARNSCQYENKENVEEIDNLIFKISKYIKENHNVD